MKKMLLFIFSVLSILLLYTSCTSSRQLKDITYFADSLNESERTVFNNFQVHLQQGDRISILVTALNPFAAQQFNVITANTQAVGVDVSKAPGNAPAPVMSDYGYIVNSDGNIQFPQLGNIHVEGKTLNDVSQILQKLLLQFLKDPTVIVNIINFRVNVIGEVNRPGTITVPDGKISILEAISQASDLTIYGRRNNILVIREKDGKREFGRIDLTSNQVFNSPYFYLKQGDVVYIEQNKNKLILSDANEARNFRLATIMLGVITAAAVTINALK